MSGSCKNMNIVDILEAMRHGGMFSKLYCAASDGDFCTVRALIQAGANLNRPESMSRVTPLFGAIVGAKPKMIEELIRAGADPNIKSAGDIPPLIAGIQAGKVEIVKALLDNGANIRMTYFTGETALHESAELGNTKITKLLIERGLDVDIRNELNETPLHVAVQAGHVDTVQFLLAKNADINATCTPEKAEEEGIELGSNATPVFLAAYWGHWHIVNILIKAGADVTVKTSQNHTALHFAVQQEAPIATVNALLRAGSDVNARSKYLGLQPLLLAAKTGRADIVQTLLKVEGVDVNPMPGGMETPLAVAACAGHLEVVKLLVANGALISSNDVTPLHMALIGKKEKVAGFLIEKGANCCAADLRGTTPLHSACEKGASLKIVKTLIEKGANVNARVRSSKKTPLHYAVNYDNVEVVKCLVDHGADLDAVDDDKWTALHYAADCGHVKIVAYLVTKVSEVDSRSSCLTTPLHQAVYKGHQEVVEILLNSGASVNVPDKMKRTPVHIALQERKSKIAELLLKRNVDVNLKEKKRGYTPLFLAVKNNDEKLVSLLLGKGADVNAVNKFGVLPIHVATNAASMNIAKALLMKGAYFDMEAQASNFSGPPLKFARKTGNANLINMLELIEKLFDAVIKNDVYLIAACIQAGVILNARDKNGKTPLHYAVNSCNVDVVKTLLANGADITITSAGDSPLHTAVAKRCFEIVEILLKHTKNIDFIKSNFVINMKAVKNGAMALHIATENNDLHIVKILLANGAVYNAKNSSAKIPLQLTLTNEAIKRLLISTEQLFEAVKEKDGLEEVTQIIQGNNAAVNARDTDGGGTPLYWSISKGHTHIANALLSNGADYCLVTNKGTTTLHIAASKGNVEIVKALLKRIGNDNMERASDFLNATTINGTTALHVASNTEIVKCLLQAGAIYNILNGGGKTPLELAQHDDVRKLLQTTHELFNDVRKGVSTVIDKVNGLSIEEFKAVMSTRNEQKQTLLEVASNNGHVKIGGKLLEKLKKLG